MMLGHKLQQGLISPQAFRLICIGQISMYVRQLFKRRRNNGRKARDFLPQPSSQEYSEDWKTYLEKKKKLVI